MSTETIVTRAPLALYLREDRDRSSGSGEYYHLTAIPAYRAPDGDVAFCTPYDPRGPLRKGLSLPGLEITCQGDERSARRPEEPTYAWTVGYRAHGLVELRDVEPMLGTLRTIDRALRKTQAAYGRAQSFGQYLAYVADALGVTQVIRQSRRAIPDERYQVLGRSDLVWVADNMIQAWAETWRR